MDIFYELQPFPLRLWGRGSHVIPREIATESFNYGEQITISIFWSDNFGGKDGVVGASYPPIILVT